MHEQTNSKNNPPLPMHQLRNTWVGGWANLLEHVVKTEHHTPSINPASCDTNPNNVGAYFLTNSLCSTGRKYTFCILVPVCIVCTIVVCCVLGLSWTTHVKNTYVFITSAQHIALLAEFMQELSGTDFCCDAIILKQDVLLCLLIGFWHLCHKL